MPVLMPVELTICGSAFDFIVVKTFGNAIQSIVDSVKPGIYSVESSLLECKSLIQILGHLPKEVSELFVKNLFESVFSHSTTNYALIAAA